MTTGTGEIGVVVPATETAYGQSRPPSSQAADSVFGQLSLIAVARYFLLGLALACLADIRSTLPVWHALSRALLMSLLFGALLLPLRRALAFLLLVAVVCPDIVQSASQVAEYGAFSVASPWQTSIGPLRPSWLIFAYCLVLLVRCGTCLCDRVVFVAALWFGTVPFVTGALYGGFSTPVASIHIPVDVKIPFLLLVAVVLFRSYMGRRPEELATLLAAFIGAVLARHLIDFVYWLLGIGSYFAGANRVSLDSTKGTVVFMLLISLSLIFVWRRRLLGSVLGVISSVLIVVYTTRMLWVTSIAAVIIFVGMMRTTKWLWVTIATGLIALAGLWFLVTVSPENIELALCRGNRFWGVEGLGDVLWRLDPVRYAELHNAIGTNVRRQAILWGSGYGSYYTELIMPFPVKMADSFPDYSLASGRFYTCHDYIIRTFFKYGLVGLAILSAVWLVPGWKCFRAFRGGVGSLGGLIVSAVAFLPTSILQLSWSGKGVIISGFLIAVYVTACELQPQAIEQTGRRRIARLPGLIRWPLCPRAGQPGLVMPRRGFDRFFKAYRESGRPWRT